jgi:hypothetical protein
LGKNEKAKVETQKEKDGLANLGKNMKTAEKNVAFLKDKLNKAREEGKAGHIITAYLREVRDAILEKCSGGRNKCSILDSQTQQSKKRRKDWAKHHVLSEWTWRFKKRSLEGNESLH